MQECFTISCIKLYHLLNCTLHSKANACYRPFFQILYADAGGKKDEASAYRFYIPFTQQCRCSWKTLQLKSLWATAGSGFVCHVIKVSPTPQMLKMRTISSFDEVLFSTSLWWYISQFHGKRKLPLVQNRIKLILKKHLAIHYEKNFT